MYMKTLENYYSQMTADRSKAGPRVRRRPKPVSPDMLNQFKAVGAAAAAAQQHKPGASALKAKPAAADKPPLLAIAFVQRWPADMPADTAAQLTKSELRVVMTSMLLVFDTPALDHLALYGFSRHSFVLSICLFFIRFVAHKRFFASPSGSQPSPAESRRRSSSSSTTTPTPSKSNSMTADDVCFMK